MGLKWEVTPSLPQEPHYFSGGSSQNGNPWILDFSQDKKAALEDREKMNQNGFQDVTLFTATEEEIEGTITWDFVNNHKIEE